jgi:hypothetical protein
MQGYLQKMRGGQRMTTLNDQINDVKEPEIEDMYLYRPSVEEEVFELPDWLTAKSPDVPVENYIDHVLNFNGSRWVAKIIRGCEGIFGALNYAVLDILFGVLEGAKTKDKGVVAHARWVRSMESSE